MMLFLFCSLFRRVVVCCAFVGLLFVLFVCRVVALLRVCVRCVVDLLFS